MRPRLQCAPGQQNLILVGDVNEWSVDAAKQSHAFSRACLPTGVCLHQLQIKLDHTGRLSFQVLSKESAWEWCLHPSRMDSSTATLVCDDRSAVSVELSILRGDAHGKNFCISEATRCTVVIHVEVEQRNFYVWYEKQPVTILDKMGSLPQWHPLAQAKLPAWKPGSVTPDSMPEAVQKGEAALRHAAAAKELAGMLLQMRDGSPGGLPWLEGMRRLFQGDLHGPASSEALHSLAESDLLDLGNLIGKAKDYLENALLSDDVKEYQQLLDAIETEVEAATVDSRISTNFEASGNWMLECTNGGVSKGLLLVHLPLLMYVHNSSHLYEMLARLNSEAARGASSSGGTGLQAMLDDGGRPYSWLVFAVVAALQILARVRVKFLADPNFPFMPLLACNPPRRSWARRYAAPQASSALAAKPPPNSTEGCRSSESERLQTQQQERRWGQVLANQLIYRGLWVPPHIDEDRARHQYAFNSFSRSLDGTLCVLDFYGRALPLARPPDWHVLLLMADAWSSSPWVMPVQFWAGPGMGEDEKELIMPPFMCFTFESTELNSNMSLKELRHHAATILRRWRGDNALQPGTDALEMLGGPDLARLLTRDISLFSKLFVTWGPAWPKPELGPRATVRFIARMFPRPGMRALLTSESQLLLSFPGVR